MAAGGDRETDIPTPPTCEDCGAGSVVIIYGGAPLCEPCYDARISEATGWPRLPHPLPPETITGPDGREHLIAYCVWRSPAGIVVEAAEGGRRLEGWEFRISFREGVVDEEDPRPDPDEVFPWSDVPAPENASTDRHASRDRGRPGRTERLGLSCAHSIDSKVVTRKYYML